MLDGDVARSQHDLQLGDIIQRLGPTRRPTGITTRRPRRCRDLGVREHRWHPLGNRVQPARQTRPLDIQPALHPRNVRERLTHRLTRRRTNIQQLEPTNNLDNTPRHVNHQRKSRFNTMRKTEAFEPIKEDLHTKDRRTHVRGIRLSAVTTICCVRGTRRGDRSGGSAEVGPGRRSRLSRDVAGVRVVVR